MQETLRQLQKAYRFTRRLIFLNIPLLAAAVASLFFNRYLTLALLAAAVAWQLLFLRPGQKRYASRVTRENLLHTVCARLGAGDVLEKSGGAITPKAIRDAGLVPVDQGENACLLCQGIGGAMDAFQVDVCDATLAESFQLVKNGKHRVHFNTGCWMRFTLPEDTGCDWRILDQDAVPTPMRLEFYSRQSALEQSPLNDVLDGRFLCYLPPDGRRPSRALLRQLKLLADYTPGRVALSLQGNTLHLFLQGRFLARPVSMACAPTEKQLAFDPMPELEYGLRLAKAAAEQ